MGTRRKGDPAKLSMAKVIKAKTVMTDLWIADRLKMGVRQHLTHLLYWERRRGEKKKISSE